MHSEGSWTFLGLEWKVEKPLYMATDQLDSSFLAARITSFPVEQVLFRLVLPCINHWFRGTSMKSALCHLQQAQPLINWYIVTSHLRVMMMMMVMMVVKL